VHHRKLAKQVLGRFTPVLLVFGIELFPECRPRRVEHHHHMARFILTEYLEEDTGEAVEGVRGLAFGIREAGYRVVGTEGEGHAVYEEKSFCHLTYRPPPRAPPAPHAPMR